MSNQLELMNNLESRMNWLADRQQLLTTNIANADTPGYRAMELAQPTFKQTLKTVQSAEMTATSPMHMHGAASSSNSFAGKAIVNHTPSEVYPTGNTVNLEDETRKAAENVMNYQMTTNLYKGEMSMLITAAGKAN